MQMRLSSCRSVQSRDDGSLTGRGKCTAFSNQLLKWSIQIARDNYLGRKSPGNDSVKGVRAWEGGRGKQVRNTKCTGTQARDRTWMVYEQAGIAVLV